MVERTLQQAVVSKSLAAGRSGVLGTSDSLEAHAPAELEAESKPSVSDTSANALADTEKAEGSSASQHPESATLDSEQEAKPGSTSAAEASHAATSKEAPDQLSTSEQHLSPDHADSSSKADARPGSKQDLLDTGQTRPGAPSSSRENGSAEAASPSTPRPDQDLAQASSASRADSATPGKATRRKSQVDSRALEREYLEGELDALGEKEQEEVSLSHLKT